MECHNSKSTARKKGTDLFFCCPWRRFWKIASLPIRFLLWGHNVGSGLVSPCGVRSCFLLLFIQTQFNLWGQALSSGKDLFLFLALMAFSRIRPDPEGFGRPRSFYKCSTGNVPDKALITPDKKVACPFFLC